MCAWDDARTVFFHAWLDLGRSDFAGIPTDQTWYLCMQKPFKRHPEFDSMIADIMRRDPEALMLLHDVDQGDNRKIVMERMERLGCDMSRARDA
jgi:predicted O-linked N-acetylglucosamine transferase (SPINDLY family)